MSIKESTFTSFTPEQAAAYAASRGCGYPQVLYDRILAYHIGERDAFLDVGTGPGTVVFDLLPHFAKGFGCDAGTEMIVQAEKAANRLNVGDRVEFAVCKAEECENAFPGEKVDLVTVAMAAHWFDLPTFYTSVAKNLKPGGTLAMWTCSSLYVHPSVPSHTHLQEILSDLEDNLLAPYALLGNLLSQKGYEGIPLPWDNAAGESLFEKESFERIHWDRDGVPSSSDGKFVLGQSEMSVDNFVGMLGSTSMVIRWREANSEKAHGEEDPVMITANRLKEALRGRETFACSPSLALIMLRRA